jgi:hypothetical protein
MADITITVTDGTVTATAITIPDARVATTVAALSAAVADSAPPANAARAVRSAIALWIRASRRTYREAEARTASEVALRDAIAAITASEPVS